MTRSKKASVIDAAIKREKWQKKEIERARIKRFELDRLICEAPLGILRKKNRNPFLIYLDEDAVFVQPPLIKEKYSDLASVILEKLAHPRNKPKREGFVSIRDWMAAAADLPGYVRISELNFQNMDTHEISSLYFIEQAKRLGQALRRVCEMIYHGLPASEASSNAYVEVASSDPDYTYLSKRFEYGDDWYCGKFPSWSKRLFFSWEHIAAHDRFFNGVELVESVDAMEIMRGSFRRHLGLGRKNVPVKPEIVGHHTKLLQIVERVVQSKCAEFEALKRAGQWPEQKQVIPCLRKTYHLTDREARSIDIVTRPDERRARGKKQEA